MKIITFCVEDGFDLKEFMAWKNSVGAISTQRLVVDSTLKDQEQMKEVGIQISEELCHSFTAEDRLAEIEERQGNKKEAIKQAG